MFEPVRGGTRGGQAEFKWSDVSADKDREHYLGHSINAPTGRWQRNKDVHWYSRNTQNITEDEKQEILKIKELETAALAVALGFEPVSKTSQLDAALPTETRSPPQTSHETKDNQLKSEKEEKKRRKAQKKEQRRVRREMRRLERDKLPSGSSGTHHRSIRLRSSSPLPRGVHEGIYFSRSRNRSPSPSRYQHQTGRSERDLVRRYTSRAESRK
ncbi:hypothetical protein AMATHDRAFT_1618 [Amanita thiersii Skay4041]|uniref:Multiple myeloma tumor-associated protein 2-like N-terminal domain-containing protein n=1 Tax=Amanita thiersii Skay4041 TaxID=703135 RepID=A0A2A9NZ36_9AGAR|nr:hypothetical protein AMATHDRAFT_1618 [Amanita thiersii Skay4041]